MILEKIGKNGVNTNLKNTPSTNAENIKLMGWKENMLKIECFY